MAWTRIYNGSCFWGRVAAGGFWKNFFRSLGGKYLFPPKFVHGYKNNKYEKPSQIAYVSFYSEIWDIRHLSPEFDYFRCVPVFEKLIHFFTLFWDWKSMETLILRDNITHLGIFGLSGEVWCIGFSGKRVI